MRNSTSRLGPMIEGMPRFAAMQTSSSLASSSRTWFSTGTNKADFLVSGQALERIWLTISKDGLSMQPMTAITLFRMRWMLEGKAGFSKSHQKLLEKVWRYYQELFPRVNFNKHGQVMLFRFGYGRSIKHGTHRKRMETFLTSST